MNRIDFWLSALALAGGVAVAASADPVQPAGYNMPNGSGQASGGRFNYWDKAYTGSGDTMADGSALFGGYGDLSDWVEAPDVWFNTENSAGDGPYVGWLFANTPNPLVSFNIGAWADPPYHYWITGIDVHMDNSQVGGVFAPESIRVNGELVSFIAPAPGTSGWATLSGFGRLSGEQGIDIQFFHSNQWVFVSEVRFDGVIPEPASWAMMIAGFGLVGSALRRQRLLQA